MFNEQVREKFESVDSALKQTLPTIEKPRAAVQEGEKLIDARQKHIKIADRSEHGWATVAEYEEDELADNWDDEKRLFRAEARAGRKRQKSVRSLLELHILILCQLAESPLMVEQPPCCTTRTC